MALTDIVPNQDDLKRTMGTLPQQLPSLYAKPEAEPTGGMPSLGGMPPLSSLPTGGGLGGLRPIVRNPQNDAWLQAQQQERSQAEKMAATPTGLTHSATPAHGFWQHLGRIAEGIGNVAGDVFAPATMSMIPGTQLNRLGQHERGVSELAGLQKQDIEAQDAASKRAYEQAQTAQIPQAAQTERERLAAQLTEHGLKLDETGNVVPQTPEEYSPEFKGGQEKTQAEIYGLKNPWAKLPENEPLSGIDNTNKALEDTYQVQHPGKPLPNEFKLGQNATKGEYQRIDGLLKNEESSLGTQAQRETANAMRSQAMAMAMMGHEQARQTANITPVMGTDPATGRTVLVSQSDAQAMGLKGVMKAEGSDVSKTMSARQWIPLASKNGKTPDTMGIMPLIDSMDKKGKLGPLASRWNDFMAGKWGAGDPEYQALKTKLDLSKTLLMNLHVGNRGGAYLMESFQDLANAKRMNAATLKSGVASELDYAKDRAMLPGGVGQESLPKTQYKNGVPYDLGADGQYHRRTK